MRILYAAEALGGGVYELVKLVAEGVEAEGHSVAIAYGVRPETPADLADQFGPEIELFPLWSGRGPAQQLAGAAKLRALARRWQPDVVHLYSAFSGFAGAITVPKPVPTIFTPQAYAFTMQNGRVSGRPAYRLAEGFASRRVSVLGACSQSEAKLARQVAGAKRVEVVLNGIAELDRRPLLCRNGNREPRVVAIGRTVPQRRPDACARILSSVAEIAEVGWIGGAAGPAGKEGCKALRAAGIEPSGWVSRERVLDELASATVYLHWTGWDGLPLSVLEAMALDVLVIASDIDPSRELLGDEQVCASEAEAVELIRAVIADPELAGRMLDSQRSRREDYGARQMIDGWLSLYQRLAGNGIRPLR